MTSILKQMGIQQWRLRSKHSESSGSVLAETELPHLSNTDHSNALFDNASARTHSTDNSMVSAEEVIDSDGIVSNEPVVLPTSAPAPAPAPAPAFSSPMVASEPGKLVASHIETLDWQGLQALVDGQTQCKTCGATNSILGAGSANADWLFVSDAPSLVDITHHQLFSGRAGQLYQAMLMAVGLDRDSVYTTSIFKCAASGDLSIGPNCDKLLYRQIELVKPKVIVALGEFAAQSIAKSNDDLERLRLQNLQYRPSQVPVIASYSPQHLLEEPLLKAGAWQDLKKCLAVTR